MARQSTKRKDQRRGAKKGEAVRKSAHAIRHTRRVNAILGFLTKGEVDAIFDRLPFEPADPARNPVDLWRESEAARANLPPLSQARIETLPDEAAPVVEEIKRRRTYLRSYERQADYHFGMVSGAALLTPQWYADMEYVDELAAQLSPRMDAAGLLRFTMPEGTITEPIVTGNQVIFTSPRLDLGADPIPDVRDVGEGELEIVVRAFSRPNYIQVVDLEGRLLLTNGVHKVLALHKRGYTEIPCVYRRVHSLPEAQLDPNSSSLFADRTFKSQRPAMVLDFLNTEVSVPVVMRSTYQVMRINIGIEPPFQVPAGQGIHGR